MSLIILLLYFQSFSTENHSCLPVSNLLQKEKLLPLIQFHFFKHSNNFFQALHGLFKGSFHSFTAPPSLLLLYGYIHPAYEYAKHPVLLHPEYFLLNVPHDKLRYIHVLIFLMD